MKAMVVVLHGANTRGIGAYGNEWIATPTLDRLAAQGVVFDQHHADHPGDIRSLLSGCYHLPPFEGEPTHPDGIAMLQAAGVRCERILDLLEPARTIPGNWDADDADETPLPDRIAAALDRLQAHDQWLLWVESDRLIPPWEVDPQTFDAYAGEIAPVDRFAEKKAADAAQAALEAALEAAQVEPELGAPVANPFAGLDANSEPEAPREPQQPWPEPPEGEIDADDLELYDRLHNTFAAVMTEMDRELGTIWNLLEQRGLAESCLFSVTSTGGYPLAEHGVIGYSAPCLHEEATHIPWIIRLPNQQQSGRRILALTQSVDLLPTLAAWFEQPPLPGVHGRNALPLIRGERVNWRQYAIFADDFEQEISIGIRTDRWSFHLPLPADENSPFIEPQLFEKPDDPHERNDLRMQHLDWCDALEDLLDAFHTATTQAGPLPDLPLPNDPAESNDSDSENSSEHEDDSAGDSGADDEADSDDAPNESAKRRR
ncbi:sulfatase family protein [Tuwongella immobilis]|uniref:Sulfatase N-terminal domain-containing protein n=1 Tax=Tuwongella immobilis TaxID=692036 RepID=A0A6C2YRQ6_9BACT|nr:sulfatase-like hydrolase/transferase [Tuwongella immobilis]VIP03849.1 arylsulfatase a family protein : Arylsulfatase A family protein OS=Singulisphaera acidiphila (strain ATCC BAA-1392 / DSM 18658 / VKM B-2454 / MOB10) GN=Sinac_7268 PE=4 SV=1: Sulfatase [Tuwongella immobilis]VTS05065.1 arylsulfatase a family protein : Arylsulfatase A family protein OS=Singulisphaera acidiphila (strain ATCC BAA-1392 / DSM 18658 / VKM B-2454 / MOB10) GN=Sinac_7268 PE=4 SV=1: Sulfatase [Tuwongella immobilis]